MAVKYGRDSLGRRYATLNGKRINATDPSEKSLPSKKHEASKSEIDRVLRHWVRNRRSSNAVSTSIERLLRGPFGLWMNVATKTSVGKFGRIYAMRELLALLKGGGVPEFKDIDPNDKVKEYSHGGEPDMKRFLGDLESAGMEVPKPTKAQEGPPPSMNEDALILKIVHSHNLSAAELRRILTRVGGSAKRDKGSSNGEEKSQ